MTNLERKKYQVEVLKVQAAKAELEFKIEERLEDINRIKEQIKVQENRVLEIEKLLNQ